METLVIWAMAALMIAAFVVILRFGREKWAMRALAWIASMAGIIWVIAMALGISVFGSVV